MTQKNHSFHIPVMGTGFTIDTPLRVARYGISSVISIVDDVLVEQMRKFYSETNNEPYEEIRAKSEDSRARRITAYLNLVDKILKRQVKELQSSPFEPGSEITRYFSMLPAGELKENYDTMLETEDPTSRLEQQAVLREKATPGSIDVNIMTKVDAAKFRGKTQLAPELSDAQAALRGYAHSTLESAIIFSAGINQRLYSYIATFKDFFPNASGDIKKKIVLKVSDYRSSIIQGKFLARRGLWVSEFRIESGLNCGGHAFASDGYLLGPILHEFKENMSELIKKLFPLYSKTLANKEKVVPDQALAVDLTVQGGIGTCSEDALLRDHFNVTGTGWGTPWLLVPEATTVDDTHMQRLRSAGKSDVFLSDSSPLGIRYWNLRTSDSEVARRERVDANVPGSACPKGFLVSNTEFTDIPICTASRAYQKKKLVEIETRKLPANKLEALRTYVLGKSCICHDLAGVATRKNSLEEKVTPAICCGPNIINFNKTATLEEMVDHIYGRISLLSNANRPHMLIRELELYIDYLKNELEKVSLDLSDRTLKYFETFRANLENGIRYYHELGEEYVTEKQEQFINDLEDLTKELRSISFASLSASTAVTA